MASASSSSSGKQPSISTSSSIANSAINLLSTLIPSSSSSSSSSATATTNSLASSQSTKASSSSLPTAAATATSDIPHQPILRSTTSRPNFRSSPSPLQAAWSADEYEPEKDFSAFSNSNHQVPIDFSTAAATLSPPPPPSSYTASLSSSHVASPSYINFLQTTADEFVAAATNTLVADPFLPTNNNNNPSPDILVAQLHDGLAVSLLLSSSADETIGPSYYDEVESLPPVNIWEEMERNYQNEADRKSRLNSEEEELQLDLGLQMSLGLNVTEDPVDWLTMTGPGGEYTEQVWGDKVVDNDLEIEQQQEEVPPVQSNKGKERAVEKSPVVMKSRM